MSVRVALSLPLDAEQRLAASAAHHGHEVVLRCSGGDELAARLPQLPVELAIVAATPQHLTPRLVETADVAGVRMLVVVDDADGARHAARLGILEPVEGPADWALLEGGRPAPVDDEPAAPLPEMPRTVRRPATVVAVWGPHGAPGRTSLAIALAAELATAGWRTVLADADTHAASVAPALGLLDEAPGFAAACRLAGIGGLDETQLERLAVVPRGARHPFRVLTGIGRPARWPELGAARVEAALAALRGLCEVVVVDLAASLERDDELARDVDGPRRNAAGLEVLRAADRVVAVGAADPVGIPRLLRGHAELLELVEPERVTVVVNKLRASAVGVNPGGQVRQTLARFGGIDDPVLVPWDPAAFDAAVLGGRPLADAAPRSAARVAVRSLAASLVPSPAATGARRGLRRRSA
ncbi:regulator [Protaetiibacter sp. SSC-01]|uniref:AAA family ATPase n=1 Tax=Protaetiibacter sp. SSC-01 TaxID=2759943 RepID=UPI001656B772|nr:regulator [Protaetiibacter sp. SSC-01]QNO37000.1 regulator [Protaetiibacter sp. SSC-01]